MQKCECTVAIGGEAGMTVSKSGVTVPELLVLRHLHGEDAVRNIKIMTDESIDSNEERARLRAKYTKPATLISDVLGPNGPLPKTVEDAGIGDEFIIETPQTRATAKTSATKALKLEQDAEAKAAQAPAEKSEEKAPAEKTEAKK